MNQMTNFGRSLRSTVSTIIAAQTIRRKPPALPPSAQAIFDQIDTNNDDEIAADQLVAWWSEHEPTSHLAESRTNTVRYVLTELDLQHAQLNFEAFCEILEVVIEQEWELTPDPATTRIFYRHKTGQQPSTWKLPTVNGWLVDLHCKEPIGLVQTPTRSESTVDRVEENPLHFQN